MSIRVTIKDKEVLSELPLVKFRTYLENKGWYKRDDFYKTMASGERVSFGEIWSMDRGPKPQTAIFVPNSEKIIDYSARMSENFMILERIENRSQLEIYVDILQKPVIVRPTKVKVKKEKIIKH